MKPFPVPVVGPGSHEVEEVAEYLPMPHDMSVFRQPIVEPGSPEAAAEAHAALSGLLQRMQTHRFGTGERPRLDLASLSPEALTLTNQAMGQGEVSAIVHGARSWRIEETTFASIWHVLAMREDGGVAEDCLEVGDIPASLRETVAEATKPRVFGLPPAPAGVMNSPALLVELLEQSAVWRPGKAAHVINLTLLPVTPQDLDYLGQALGVGPVTILSRGYGNCRITSTQLPHTWWVQYFNSMDVMILNTIEVVDVPEVALAAREDFEDSTERLAEWLETLLDD
jgi:hydrogenase-1 operon protein HyaF